MVSRKYRLYRARRDPRLGGGQRSCGNRSRFCAVIGAERRRGGEDRSLDETDSELVERARKGDPAAFETLVRRYQNHAFRVAYLLTGSPEDAAEAAQDGFVRAFRALHRFRPGEPFRPWLLTIVANAARNRRVAANRHPSLTLNAVAEHADNQAIGSPESQALADERDRELLAAVNTLRLQDRQVIAFRYFLDLSEAEIAAALGCARGTVKSRLSRALSRLRQAYAVSGERGGDD